MKIVTIIQRYPPAIGGSEIWCQEVCRYLADRGHVVNVLTMDVNKEEEFWQDAPSHDRTLVFGKFAFDRNIAIRRYKRSLPIYTFYHIVYKFILDRILRIYFYGPHSGEMYGKMWRIIKEADVIFLNTHPYPHNFIALFIAKFLRKKIAFVPHFHPAHPFYERWSNYWLLKKCDVVIADSEFEKEYLASNGVATHKILDTGVGVHPGDYLPVELDEYRAKLEREHGLNASDLIITFIGRKMPDKGVGTLIDAVRQIYKDHPVKLFLVGPSFEWFKEYYVKLSDEEKTSIIDLGILSHQDKVNLLHLSHLLALPSKFEAFGIVFLEAWICGVPVLGTEEGAMPNIIGNDGFLSKFGDVADLKMNLLKALKDRKALKAMGVRGRNKVLKLYTWEVIGKKAEQAMRLAYGKKKILIVSNAYPPNFIGGAELIAHYQAKKMKEKGNEVLVFAGDSVPATVERYSTRKDVYEGMNVVRIALYPEDYSHEYFNFFHRKVEDRFDEVLDSFAPDVVHFHNITGLSVGLIHSAKRRHIKTVQTFHDHWGFCFKNTLIKREGEICNDYSKCYECKLSVSGESAVNVPIQLRKDYFFRQLQEIDTYITPSKYLSESYIQANLDKNKFKVIWYGIDVERFSNQLKSAMNGQMRFTFVGYMGDHKGVSVLLDSLCLINRRGEFKLNLVGMGHQLETYKAKVKKSGLDGSVKFWGKLDNAAIEEVYRETDVMILPSIWPENQPVTITEAMASGIPVIASRIGGIPELIDEGETGYLVEPGNAKQLAQKIEQCIDNPEVLSMLGKNALKKITDDTYDLQVSKILDVYEAEPQKKTNSKTPLIVCTGRMFAGECLEVIDEVAKKNTGGVHFVLSDWIDDDQLQEARALLVVDRNAVLESVSTGLINRIPLIVPGLNRELLRLCSYANCGLYYKGADELVGCLEFLLENEDIAHAMGIRGYQYLMTA